MSELSNHGADDTIGLRHIKAGFSRSTPIVLGKSPQIRLIFIPAIHEGGVRGTLVRQKIGPNDNWEDFNKIDFRKVPPNFLAKLELDTKATRELFEHLEKLYEVQNQGVPRKNQELVVTQKNKAIIIDDNNKQKVIQQIIDKGHSEEVWESLSQANPDLATRLSMAKIQSEKQDVIEKFKEALTQHPDDEGYWQHFFQEEPWILEMSFSSSIFMLGGETYLGGKLSRGRQGSGGVATDFLFSDQSTKSFLVIEIKTPGSKLVGSIYRGQSDSEYDNDVYSMASDLSGGITQVQNQLRVAVENFQSALGKSFPNKINCIDPRAILVTGNFKSLSNNKVQDSFNQFRKGFYSPAIVTFDELLNRLERLFGSKDARG